jgi:hypothetical protein
LGKTAKVTHKGQGARMNDLTTSYFSIEKSDKQPDGTLMVYGKATDDSVDIDQQICDAAWLDRAMPAWFKSGGNIREQHSSIAAGVAKEYEPKADGHYIMAHIVDPVSVKKVDAGVLRGFSIGIKSPRVVRDTKAVNGRIIDGQIVEVSLVDRPANPNCQLVLAKSVDGESSLVQVEELTEIEKHGSHNQSSHGRRGSGGGGAGGAASQTTEDKVPSARVDRTEQSLSTTQSKLIDTHAAEARGLADDAQALAKRDSMVRPAARNLTSAAEHLNNASGAKTIGEAKEGIKRAKIVIERAALNLEDQNYNIEASNAFALSKDLNSTMTGLGNGVIKEVDADLEKHGSHNQSSHGRRGAGGGGGGSTSKAEARKELVKANAAMNKGYDKILDEERKPGKPMSERHMDAAQMRDDAFSHTEDAVGAIGKGDSSSAVKSLRNAADSLAGESAFKPAENQFRALADKLEESPLEKSTNADLRKALQSALHLYSLNKSEEATMDQALVELPVEVVADLLKFDAAQYESARNALARLIEVEAKEMGEGSNEIQSIGHLLQSVMHLTAWYEGEEAEGEVMEQETMIERAAKSYKNMKPAKDEPKPDFMKRCKDAGMDDDAAKACWDKYMSADVDAEKSAEISKCLECGCNQPGSDHGLTTTNDFANVAKPSNVTTAEMYAPGETPKSAEGEEAPTVTEEEVKAAEPATEETPAVETTEVSAEEKTADVEALVEQVVKSATESLKSEIAELVSAKEAALSKAMSLETELELAKSLAVAGGPSRTARPLNVKTTSDLLTKAAIYKAKANATTDPTLAKGYKSLAEEFLNKANEADNK